MLLSSVTELQHCISSCLDTKHLIKTKQSKLPKPLQNPMQKETSRLVLIEPDQQSAFCTNSNWKGCISSGCQGCMTTKSGTEPCLV